METDKLVEEHIDRRQEILNGIYDKYITFPVTDIDVDPDNESDLGILLFSYRFPEGTTTPGFSDLLSGKRNVNTGELIIYYEKGIHAGKITLLKNQEKEEADLKNFVVFHKEASGSLVIDQVATKPHLHAIESLLNDIELRMESYPDLFKTDTEKKEQLKKQRELLRLHAIILGRMARQASLRKKEEEKRNNGSGRKKI